MRRRDVVGQRLRLAPRETCRALAGHEDQSPRSGAYAVWLRERRSCNIRRVKTVQGSAHLDSCAGTDKSFFSDGSPAGA